MNKYIDNILEGIKQEYSNDKDVCMIADHMISDSPLHMLGQIKEMHKDNVEICSKVDLISSKLADNKIDDNPLNILGKIKEMHSDNKEICNKVDKISSKLIEIRTEDYIFKLLYEIDEKHKNQDVSKILNEIRQLINPKEKQLKPEITEKAERPEKTEKIEITEKAESQPIKDEELKNLVNRFITIETLDKKINVQDVKEELI